MCSRRPALGTGIAASDTRVSSRFPTASSHPFSRSSRTQRAYHPSMGYYGAPGNMAPPPVSLEAMMYGMGAPPGGGGYVDYEAMYRELQLRMYAQQQQQGGMRPSPGGSPHPHSPHQPPLPPGRAPPSMMPGGAPTPGDHSHAAALTAEALRQYQAAQASGGAFVHGSPEYSADGGMGGWEEGDDEDSSTTTDGSKQSVARRRHARRRRQLARLAADKMEWEARSRQMEAALLEKGGDLAAAGGVLENASSRNDASLFADFRAALARALLITEEALDREGGDVLGDGETVNGDRYTDTKTGTNTETAESEELASRILEELRDDVSTEDDVSPRSRTEGDERDGEDDGEDGEKTSPPRRRSFERRRASFVSSTAPSFGSVSFGKFLSSFRPNENDVGIMTSRVPGGGAFDSNVVGMEAVAALEHGLLKAQLAGLFAPSELLVTAVSTKDMLTCYAGGGCADVLGAPAESFIHTSLLDGLHAEDVRNLVFAFHLFPTILPEVSNLDRRDAQKGAKGAKDEGAGAGSENQRESSTGSEPWAKERAKMRARAAHDAEGVLPLPDAAQLLPHGYLRRRLADGRFVAMERLGGMIVSNDTAASVLAELRSPSVEELSTLFGGGNRSPQNESPPEQRTHSLSSLETAPSAAERAAALRRRDAGAAALGGEPTRPTSLDETKAVTGAFDAMALADEKKKVQNPATATRGAPATERPYPGSAAEDERAAPGASPPPASAATAAASGDVVLNKYHPSKKRDAKPDALGLGRSAISAPNAGRPSAGEAQALSPAASSFVYPSGAAGAKILSGPAPPSTAPPTSTVEAARARKAAEEAEEREKESASRAETLAESPATDEGETLSKDAKAEATGKEPATYATPTGASVVLNKYHPSKKRESGSNPSRAVPAARTDSRTTEAEISSLVAHCVRHTEKATPGARREPKEESLPEGIKDVLRRLTRETFSEHTVLVTIERVRGIGGYAGSEARHNAQMMVVSKLLNDLAIRRHRAMPSAAA